MVAFEIHDLLWTSMKMVFAELETNRTNPYKFEGILINENGVKSLKRSCNICLGKTTGCSNISLSNHGYRGE